ncbi:6-phospho-3-hexuloisomerase [Epilithonimonas tenax]|uniref:6-phospho-3-hexuloisomerase n=1 Tax=Epilithonimonas tenax TaxID=191577 RepID=UPI000410E4EE|nr:6-phospho-3-hexuloisomerase [Epilithonimonas tenax]
MAYQELTRQYLDLILEENQRSTQDLDTSDLDILIQDIKTAKRIFFMGTGRSGLALRMAAMRLMHIGLAVFIVGDTLTPAILEGDILLAASGSGTTPSVINVVEKAISQKAKVTVLTASLESKLAQLADHILFVPAASKTDFGISASAQYAGSLFEQSVLFVFETTFMVLWKESGLTKEDLWPKHANLE